MAAIKTPKFQTKIHLPEIPGSFTFRKNGKCRLDQQVKKFCLLNQCRGCFEVKVHFGRNVNHKHIKYDAQQNGMEFDTLDDQQKFKLFVPYPKGLTLNIPSDPEAQFFCGVLSAKLAIVSYDKSVIKTKTKTKRDKIVMDKNNTDSQSAKRKKSDKSPKNSQKQRRQRQKQKKQKRKVSLNELNQRISNNTEPPKKKRKVKIPNSNEMTVNAQYELIDGVVDKMEDSIKEKRKSEVDKDTDIKEYLRGRAEKKKLKEQKKKDIREKFRAKRERKKKSKRLERKTLKKSTGKKVTFNL